jgi:hypothetical protein
LRKYTARASSTNSASKSLGFLLEPDPVFDVPEKFVDGLEPGALRPDVDARRRVRRPSLVEQSKFGAHVGELASVGHAFGLDFEDRDLVDQLAEGNGGSIVRSWFTV